MGNTDDFHFDKREKNLVKDFLEGVKNLLKPIEKKLDKIETNHLSHIEVYMSQICKRNNVPYVDPKNREPKKLNNGDKQS